MWSLLQYITILKYCTFDNSLSPRFLYCVGHGLDRGEIAGITIAVIVFSAVLLVAVVIGTYVALKRNSKYAISLGITCACIYSGNVLLVIYKGVALFLTMTI